MSDDQAYEIGDVIGQGPNALEVTEVRKDGDGNLLSYGMRLHDQVEAERQAEAEHQASLEETASDTEDTEEEGDRP